jgi:signal transduction histidine kinase/DNA-binding response OmpR family regulator/ligand-binding sensor domain-containing protein
MFINYKHDPQDSHSLSHNAVWSLYQSDDHSIWVGTDDGTLHRYDYRIQKFSRVVIAEDVHKTRQLNKISFIGQHPSDQPNVLTIGTGGGIYKYDYQENKLINYYDNLIEIVRKVRKKERLSFNGYLVASDGTIWAVADNDGIYIIPKTNDQILHYISKRNDPYSLAWKSVRTVYEDQQGIIWIGLGGSVGIQKYDKQSHNFNYYSIAKDTVSNIFSIHEDLAKNNHTIWLGTGSQGLIKYERHTRQIKNVIDEITYPISVICQIPHNLKNLWIGTVGGGLFKFDIISGSLDNYIYHSPLEDILNESKRNDFKSAAFLISMLCNKKGQLWLGSVQGLYKFDPENNKYTSFRHDPDNPYSISANEVSALCESDYNTDSVLWIGTRTGGLNKLDLKSGKFISFQHDPEDSSSLSSNYINSILEDEDETLWIGTTRGLNQYNRSDNTFTRIMDKDKKLNSEVQSILADKSGNLWMNTNSGVHKFEPKTGTLRTYTRAFNRWAYHKSSSGEMFFAGGNAILTFNPANIKNNIHIPPVVLTDFQIFNESVKVGLTPESPLQKSISETDIITLSHDQSVFSFEFSVLDYSDPLKNQYAYKMEGIDRDWVHTDASRRFATYTHLDPGEYVFRVKGSNNDGLWNEEGTSIKIIITPPWWKTTWAYSIYFITLCALLYSLRRYDTKRQRLKHDLELEHLHTEKLEEVDRMKSRFFANISHEFRTPLTLIRGPINQMLSGEFTGNLKEQYRMIKRNSDRLLRLINQLLDISKLESGKMKLQVSEGDIVEFLKQVISAFESLAVSRNIALDFICPEKSILAYYDRDKLEKIITNLISNAFKFTPEGGRIEVAVGSSSGSSKGEAFPGKILNKSNAMGPIASPQRPQTIQITISNTGPGIPPEQLDKIFDRFYQADTTFKKELAPLDSVSNATQSTKEQTYPTGEQGSGIGLALTKELVELHHGTITVSSGLEKYPPQSPLGRGEAYLTTFSIILPISKEHFTEDEIIETPSREIIETDFPPRKGGQRGVSKISEEITISQQIKPSAISNRSPLLLIVEDNPDVTSYICTFMENDFRIITAENGRIGLTKTINKYPDLVISDVMMPEMDGFELCNKIKSDQRTSHIPVILLTAKADMDSKIEGLEFGADDYISKPFDAKELHARVKNLIEQRKKLREKFSQATEIKPGEIATTSMDEQFLKRLLVVFENHVSESDFSTDDFAREVGMSRSNLHRKLQALTNQPTHEFIRSLRLKRAAQLLKKSAGSVTEIAYAVGFNNLSYFTKTFRQQFGQNPREFAKKTNRS